MIKQYIPNADMRSEKCPSCPPWRSIHVITFTPGWPGGRWVLTCFLTVELRLGGPRATREAQSSNREKKERMELKTTLGWLMKQVTLFSSVPEMAEGLDTFQIKPKKALFTKAQRSLLLTSATVQN